MKIIHFSLCTFPLLPAYNRKYPPKTKAMKQINPTSPRQTTEKHSHLSNEELQKNYENTLNSILEADDENAKDNMSDYMDELKEESNALE